jgi:hypothetical protein
LGPRFRLFIKETETGAQSHWARTTGGEEYDSRPRTHDGTAARGHGPTEVTVPVTGLAGASRIHRAEKALSTVPGESGRFVLGIDVVGMRCEHCERTITHALTPVGVEER